MLKPGEQAPDFTFTDIKGKQTKLSDLKGRKVIVYFYPKDNTPGCTAEACSFRDNYHDLQAKGYYVIGVSADPIKSHENFKEKFQLPFTLVSDTDKIIIQAYGAWGPKKFMGRSFDGILRSTFIIDENGVIEHVIEKVDTKDSVGQIYRLAKIS